MLLLTEPTPFAAAFVASLLIGVAAWRMRALSASGAAAATLTGAVALSVSLGFGAFLAAWFVLATAISRIGKTRKAERVAGLVEKGGPRDAAQVLANGGVFVLALAGILIGRPDVDASRVLLLAVAAAGSLTAAGADTWATEVGTLFGGEPYSIRTAARVATGTSGAITLAGSLAMFLGAGLLAILAALTAAIPFEIQPILAVATGGVLGALTDTVIGAWFQERRRCPQCGTFTEQSVHSCGSSTEAASGIGGLNNDVVNAVCAVAGAIGAVAVVLL